MRFQKGFIPIVSLFITTITAITLLTSIAGFSFIHSIPQKKPQSPTISPTDYPRPSPTSPQITNADIHPTYPPPTVTPSTGIIKAVINDNGQPITDTSLTLHIRNENTQEEQVLNNVNSSWIIPGIKPDKYKISIPFSYKNYFNPDRSCEGCRDKEDKSDFEVCGYVVVLRAGDNIKISCTLRKTQQFSLPENTEPADTLPPQTSIFYPQPNGSITYKTDGKVCAYEAAPSDNGRSTEGLQTFYKFDDRDWQTGMGYLCADSLPNGPHTISFYSKDKAGNVETTSSFSFTVNIPGN